MNTWMGGAGSRRFGGHHILGQSGRPLKQEPVAKFKIENKFAQNQNKFGSVVEIPQRCVNHE